MKIILLTDKMNEQEKHGLHIKDIYTRREKYSYLLTRILVF